MEQGTFGGVYNAVKLVRADAEVEAWPKLSKAEVATRLAVRIAEHLRAASAAAA
jgi:phosphopantothenoylcysteine decarboxylase/phosphopantothenate--cysteine ligase